MGSGRDDAESVSEANAQSGNDSNSGGGWCGLLLVVGVLAALGAVALRVVA